MKRMLMRIALCQLFLFIFISQAVAYDLTIGRMRVAIWPEYDDPGILVIYDGRFKDADSFPTETTFLLPKGAVISDACSLSPKGQHFCQLYTQKNRGSVDEVRLKLPYPNFYLSFHISPFAGGGEERHFNYAVNLNHPTDKLEIDIQRPLRADNFGIVPSGAAVSEKKGFEHHGYVYKGLSAGKALDFTVRYVKKDSQPSVNIKYSPMAGQNTDVSAPANPYRISAIIYMAGIVGVLLVGGMLWLILREKK